MREYLRDKDEVKKRLNCLEHAAPKRKTESTGQRRIHQEILKDSATTPHHRLSFRQLTVFREKKFKKLSVLCSVDKP